MMNLTIGQEVAVQQSAGKPLFGFAVTKMTPGGQVVIKRQSDGYAMRFNKNGWRMDTVFSSFRRDRLIVDVAAVRERLDGEQKRENAVAKVNAVRGEAGRYYDKNGLLAEVAKLEDALKAARAAVEAL